MYFRLINFLFSDREGMLSNNLEFLGGCQFIRHILLRATLAAGPVLCRPGPGLFSGGLS